MALYVSKRILNNTVFLIGNQCYLFIFIVIIDV